MCHFLWIGLKVMGWIARQEQCKNIEEVQYYWKVKIEIKKKDAFGRNEQRIEEENIGFEKRDAIVMEL